jgi:hypothetical protein
LLCAALVLPCLAAGCGQSDGLDKLMPVKGKVVFTGRPISAGNVRAVILTPDRGKGNTTEHEPRAWIDQDGNYEVFTTPKRAGAPPGDYKVAVQIMESPMNTRDMYTPPKWLIDAKYGNCETSGLTLHVVEKPAEGAYDLKIESK